MALVPQIVPIVLTKGVQTKVDEKLVVQGQLLVLENRFWTKMGRLEKRYGYKSLSRNITSSTGTITSGSRIGVFNDDLLLMDQDRLFSYSPSRETWTPKGNLITTTVASKSIVRNSNTQAMADMAYLDGMVLTVWEDSQGGVRCSLFDEESNTPLIYDTQISTAGSRPKCLALSSGFVITYLVANGGAYDLRSRSIEKLNPVVIRPEVVTMTTLRDTPYDITNYSSVGIIAAGVSGGGLELGYIDLTGTTPLTWPANKAYSAVTMSWLSLSVTTNPIVESIAVILGGSTTNEVWGFSASLIDSPTNVYSATLVMTSTCRNITACYSNNNIIKIIYEDGAASPTTSNTQYLTYMTATWDGPGNAIVVGTPHSLMHGLSLYTKMFLVDDVAYVVGIYYTPLQPTYYLINELGSINSKILNNTGGFLTADAFGALKSGLAAMSVDGFGSYIFPAQLRNSIQTATDTSLSSTYGLTRISVNFAAGVGNGETLGQNYHSSGGIVTAYDGVKNVELGFNVWPEPVQNPLPVTHSSGGTWTDTRPSPWALPGSWSYYAIYQWVDGNGQVHRSAPSIEATATITASTDTVAITFPRLRLTSKTGVQCVIFRTEKDQTIPYRLGAISNDYIGVTAPWNGSDAMYLTYTDTYSTANHQRDEDINVGEILYTTGGILENIAPPACTIIHRHINRLFIAGLEDPDTVEYSKERVINEGVAFSDSFVMRVDPTGGAITALATLDDKLIIFKKSALFLVSGDGPLDTGAQNNFTQPQRIQGDIGAVNQDGVINVPAGLMFKSAKGIWLLDRSLQLSYIGAAVDAYNTLSITSCQVMPEVNQVRFTTNENLCLVFDYFWNEWYTFTNYSAVSSVVWKEQYLMLASSGKVNKETPGSYNDNGTKITTAIETSWMNLAGAQGLQGFQRVREIALLGEYVSSHLAKIQVAYDFEKFYNETILFDADPVFAAGTFGSDAYYGELSPFGGGTSTTYQYVVKLARQKCQAIKLRIEDLDKTAVGGAAFHINALTANIGMKQGINRLPTTQQVGSL